MWGGLPSPPHPGLKRMCIEEGEDRGRSLWLISCPIHRGTERKGKLSLGAFEWPIALGPLPETESDGHAQSVLSSCSLWQNTQSRKGCAAARCGDTGICSVAEILALR